MRYRRKQKKSGRVCATITKKKKKEKSFSLLPVAEGRKRTSRSRLAAVGFSFSCRQRLRPVVPRIKEMKEEAVTNNKNPPTNIKVNFFNFLKKIFLQFHF